MLVIFDLDDTLIDTSNLFWKVREEFISALNISDIPVESVRDDFEKEDSLSIQKFGYHPDRYGKTMLMVLENFVKSKKIDDSEELRKKISIIGNKISNEVPDLIDGSIQVLEILKRRKYKMALITRGSFEVQSKKIEHHNLKQYFSSINIVDKKDKYIFNKTIKKMGGHAEDTFIIGDSIRSDINPGLSLNANCIHYVYKHEHYNWIQEHGDDPISKEFYKVSDLREIPKILKRFSNNHPEEITFPVPAVQYKLALA